MNLFQYLIPISLLILSTCTPIQNTRGYLIDDQLVEQIETGIDSKDSVLRVLGSPSNVATFETDLWYYITRKTESLAFLEKKLLDQKVVAIKFNKLGLVEEIKRFNAEDGRAIRISERITETRGKQLTLFQQLFGNIGRFANEEEE